MQEFKRIFFPHWLSPAEQQNRGKEGFSSVQSPNLVAGPHQQRTQTPKPTNSSTSIVEGGLQLRDEPDIGTLHLSKSSQSAIGTNTFHE